MDARDVLREHRDAPPEDLDKRCERREELSASLSLGDDELPDALVAGGRRSEAAGASPKAAQYLGGAAEIGGAGHARDEARVDCRGERHPSERVWR